MRITQIEKRKRNGAKRSNEWSKVRREFVSTHKECAVCGRKTFLQVHHKKPFHLFPELELKKSNLVILCEPEGVGCHLRFGHLGSFKSYNPECEKDVGIWHKKIKERP